MNNQIREILRTLKARLVELYGERLKGVYLFGSYVREEVIPACRRIEHGGHPKSAS